MGPHLGQDSLVMRASCPLFKHKLPIRTLKMDTGGWWRGAGGGRGTALLGLIVLPLSNVAAPNESLFSAFILIYVFSWHI